MQPRQAVQDSVDAAIIGGGLNMLRDKQVGIIGTGATALQCIPFLAQSAQLLTVFQRTPFAIFYRANQTTDMAWATGLQPGWQQQRIREFSLQISGRPAPQTAIVDEVIDLMQALTALPGIPDGTPMAAVEVQRILEDKDFRHMKQVRARIMRTVTDQATAAALQVWYRLHCQWSRYHDGYLEVFTVSMSVWWIPLASSACAWTPATSWLACAITRWIA